MRTPQYELANSGEAFNLAVERGVDPERVIRERIAADKARTEAREYQAKMQRMLAECPGVIGWDLPGCECGKGKVTIEPGRIADAMPWLKRRFHVSEILELSTDCGLCVEWSPRRKGKARIETTKGKRVKVTFGPLEQFTLGL